MAGATERRAVGAPLPPRALDFFSREACLRWFDGHLDLTYIALHGRDPAREAADAGGILQPASVTFPALSRAQVRACFSTIFVRRRTAEVSGDFCFNTPEEAHAAAMRQLAMHDVWEEAGLIARSLPKDERQKTKDETENAGRLAVSLAVEGAACLRTPDDLDIFHAAGVRMVALAWAEGSHYAGGDQNGGDLTPEGRQLIARLDNLAMTHDVSHLSERAFWSLLDAARGRVVASHSNCRALLSDAKSPERHLSDAQIRAVAARGGTIGINLFARFLIPATELARRRAAAVDVVRHITHIEQVAGRRDIVALGSDMDSGFGTDLLPADIQGPGELHHLAEALADAGWNNADIAHFAWGWDKAL